MRTNRRFSLHAGVVTQAHQHSKLERSCRYKVAALAKTIAYPLENDLYLSDPRLLLALLLFVLTVLLDMALFRRLHF